MYPLIPDMRNRETIGARESCYGCLHRQIFQEFCILKNMEDDNVIEKAIQWMDENKKSVLKNTVLNKEPRKAKECILMAGSPGAGKTETVRRLNLKENFIILEADEIRVLNPHYKKTEGEKKGNAHLIQKAAGKGLEHCRKHCIENEIAFVQDTTLSNRGSMDLIKKLFNKGWDISIIFIYQDPKKAWEFTKAREEKEGRNIPKNDFADSFANIVNNIKKIQKKYPEIRVILNIKDGIKVTKHTELKGKSVESVFASNNIKIPESQDVLKLIG